VAELALPRVLVRRKPRKPWSRFTRLCFGAAVVNTFIVAWYVASYVFGFDVGFLWRHQASMPAIAIYDAATCFWWKMFKWSHDEDQR
jgi:hypothetical protein